MYVIVRTTVYTRLTVHCIYTTVRKLYNLFLDIRALALSYLLICSHVRVQHKYVRHTVYNHISNLTFIEENTLLHNELGLELLVKS